LVATAKDWVDFVEACFDSCHGDSGDRTHELVSAVTHDRLVASDLRAHRADHVTQPRVAGRVSEGVVGGVQALDVDEGEHQAHNPGACVMHRASAVPAVRANACRIVS
jgi:hypothetical protein